MKWWLFIKSPTDLKTKHLLTKVDETCCNTLSGQGFNRPRLRFGSASNGIRLNHKRSFTTHNVLWFCSQCYRTLTIFGGNCTLNSWWNHLWKHNISRFAFGLRWPFALHWFGQHRKAYYCMIAIWGRHPKWCNSEVILIEILTQRRRKITPQLSCCSAMFTAQKPTHPVIQE